MACKLMGKKRGMTRYFDEAGNVRVCTVIHAEPNVVTQIKTKASDGYSALQLGYDLVATRDPRTVEKRISKPLRGHFAKHAIAPRKALCECRVEEGGSFTVGQEMTVSLFSKGSYVDVTATSKGRGFQGVMKRYNFRGGPAAHGSGFHRHGGSTGMRSTPGRCLPGQKKAGHMGNVRVTVQNLQVVAVDEARQLILVEGAVPGHRGALVTLAPAVKKVMQKKDSRKRA